MKPQLFLFATICIVLIQINSIRAAASIELLEPNPDHPNKCWIKSSNKAYNVGEKWNESGCSEARCDRHGDKFAVQRVSCGVVASPPNCRVVTDNNQKYPDCCPKVKCP